MRTSALITISLPPKMVFEVEKAARTQHMTRSELMRVALRDYLEEQDALRAVATYKKELHAGKLKELKGSLVDLMR